MVKVIEFEVDDARVTLTIDLDQRLPTKEEYPTLFPDAKVVRMLSFRYAADTETKSGESVQVIVKHYDHVSLSLPKHCEGAPHYTPDGRPAFQNKREVTEFMSRLNGKHGTSRQAVWD